jgi:hypothetical protein
LKFYDQGTLEEFDSASPEFRKLVNQCARGIEQTLGEMRRQRLGIYVVATDDLRTQRQRLCTEFENRGYRALPEYSFLKDESGEVLSQSRAGIFMIGQTPDDSLDAEYRLVLEELNTGRDFRPFVWTPKGLSISGSNRLFLDRVMSGSARVEVVSTSFEDLLDYVERALQTPAKHAEKRALPLIYCVCVQQDMPEIQPLTQALREKHLEILFPEFTGGPRTIRETHRKALQICDGVVVYWGTGGDEWLRANLYDVTRARDRTQDRHLIAVVYMGPPDNPEKRAFDMPDFNTIHAENGGRVADLVNEFTGGPAAPAAI